MRIHEFGTEHEKTVLLLHSACLSWRMFCPAVIEADGYKTDSSL